MTRLPTHHACRAVARATTLAVVLGIALSAGCSAPQPVEPTVEGPPDVVAGIPPDELPDIAAKLRSAGRTVYYLGPTARGLELNSVADIANNGPAFEAGYGSCDSGGDGGCFLPVTVSTFPWEPSPPGPPCRQLEPRLSVPTLLIYAEVHLYTGRQVVRLTDVLDGDPTAGDRADHALALVPQLRPVGAAEAADSLPPPDPDVVTWIEQTCAAPSAPSP